ncbi:hypothetical protein C5B85_11735 [Pseudoclavibacter sp. AY1F1]|uniref:hypothetical protein n=1 Tax=Pseudoclavibacter sp. AY1F1 TaxID=2080583 RepID=UPI000CE85083|nr:hypothetical protein [Pseudoclavibacter sp. AY1F1]PPF43814.1 hypothetical protein C5B85_11735 [Pseudoclavibacter sp. AY1F1]
MPKKRASLLNSGGNLYKFAMGLLATCALSAIGLPGPNVAFFVALATMIAILVPATSVLAELAFSIIGVVASIPAIWALLSGSGCVDLGVGELVGRYALVLLLLILTAGAVFASATIGDRPLPSLGLGLFGGVEIVAFIMAPGGLDAIGLGRTGLPVIVLGIIVVLLIGGLLPFQPEMVIFAAAGVVTAGNILLASVTSQAGICEGGTQVAGNDLLLVGGVVTYVVLMAFGLLVSRVLRGKA